MGRHDPKRSMSGFIGSTGGLPADPVNTVAPSITGTTTNGSTLTANPGTTGTTYVLTGADVGSTITVTVTGRNWAGVASATSAPTATIT